MGNRSKEGLLRTHLMKCITIDPKIVWDYFRDLHPMEEAPFYFDPLNYTGVFVYMEEIISTKNNTIYRGRIFGLKGSPYSKYYKSIQAPLSKQEKAKYLAAGFEDVMGKLTNNFKKRTISDELNDGAKLDDHATS